MEWLMPEVSGSCQHLRWPVLLLVCPNLDRMQSHENALQAAGYTIASASTVDAAHGMAQLCKFDIVLLDHECASEEKAEELRQKYVSVLLERGTTERELLVQLSQILQMANASAAVQ